MEVTEPIPFVERVLTARRLRALLRGTRSLFVPERLAERFRHQWPEIAEADLEEVLRILRRVADRARNELSEAGIEPEPDALREGGMGGNGGLTGRDREHAANFAALLAWIAAAYGTGEKVDGAIAAAREGLAWCRLARDDREETILWSILSNLYEQTGSDQHVEAGRRALEAARRSGTAPEIISGMHRLAEALIRAGETDEAETMIAEAFEILRTCPNDAAMRLARGILLKVQGRVEGRRNRYPEALRKTYEALQWIDDAVNPLEKATVLQTLGVIYHRLDRLEDSVRVLHESARFVEIVGNNVGLCWIHISLAETYQKLRDLDAALDALDRAERYVDDPEGSLALNVAAGRADVLVQQNNYDQALPLLNWIIPRATQPSLLSTLVAAHALAATSYKHLNDYEHAEEHTCKAIELSEGFGHHLQRLKLRLAEIYALQGRYDRAAAMLDEIDGLIVNPSADYVKLLRQRSTIDEKLGDLKSALETERQASTIEREMLQELSDRSFINARIVAETEQLEREVEMERERRERIEHELAEAVMQISDRQAAIDSAARQVHHAIVSAGANTPTSKILGAVLDELRGPSGEAESPSPLIYLQSVGEDFYRRLRERWPGLTQKQERLCGLIRVGLSSKEICSMLDLTPDGLKAQRKRLRKRLGLEMEEGLEEVIGNV